MHELAELTAPVTPATALRRIATLAERTPGDSRRITAYRAAAAAWEAVPASEQAEHLRAETVTEIPEIGASTAEVITQAATGQLPDRLAAAQEQATGLELDGAELFAAIVGDAHTHSEWSDGSTSIEEMVLTAALTGHEWMVLTDHSPRLKIANGLSAARLTRQLEVIEGINTMVGGVITLLPGIEVDILDDGALDQTPEMLARLALVTASVHSKLAMNAAPMTRRMVAAVRNPRVNVLGHATGRLVMGSRGTRAQSEFNAEEVFTACLESGTAVEINSRPERCDPPDELIELARDLGCLFAIDSDAHAPGQLLMKAHGAARATRLGIDADRVITTWPLERLREWIQD